MKQAEVVVVGASACGSIAAKAAAQQGARVLTLEEDPKPGKYGKCSGIMSKKGLDSLGVDYSLAIVNEINGARVWSGEKHFKVETSHVQAIVLDRQRFDEMCCGEAQDAGAELVTGARVVSATPRSATDSRGNPYLFNQLIGADGADSTIAKLFSFPRIAPADFVLAYEAEFENCNVQDERIVDVFLGKATFPGFFGWIIPAGDNKARIGLAVKHHSRLNECKQRFFSFPQVKLTTGASCSKCRDFYHVIPLKTRGKTQKGNVYLCGDAAGQVKSTTGGGVVFGGNCAKLAGEVAVANSRGENRNYEAEWRSKYGKTLASHSAIRSAFDRSPQWLVDLTVSALKASRGTKLIEKFGDMDYITSVGI